MEFCTKKDGLWEEQLVFTTMHHYTHLLLCIVFLALLAVTQAGFYSSLFKKDGLNKTTLRLHGLGGKNAGREEGDEELPPTTWRSGLGGLDNGSEYGVGTVGTTERGTLSTLPTEGATEGIKGDERSTEVPREPATEVHELSEPSTAPSNLLSTDPPTTSGLPASTVVPTTPTTTTTTIATSPAASTTTTSSTTSTAATTGSPTTSAGPDRNAGTTSGATISTTSPKPMEVGNGTGIATPPTRRFGPSRNGTRKFLYGSFVPAVTYARRLGFVEKNLRRTDERSKDLEAKLDRLQRLYEREKRKTQGHADWIRHELSGKKKDAAFLRKAGIFGLSLTQGQILTFLVASLSVAIWMVLGLLHGLALLDHGFSTGRWLTVTEPEATVDPSPPPPSLETPPPTYEEVTTPPEEPAPVVRGAEALPLQPAVFTLGEPPLRHPLQRSETVRRRWGLAALTEETQF